MTKNPRLRRDPPVAEKQQKQTFPPEVKEVADRINIGNASEDTAPTEKKPDEEPTAVKPRTTRNGTIIELVKNDLPSRKRNRKAHGTNLTIPLYFEELIAIETALEEENQADSLNDFIRDLLLAKAEEILGERKYKKVLANEINKVKKPSTE